MDDVTWVVNEWDIFLFLPIFSRWTLGKCASSSNRIKLLLAKVSKLIRFLVVNINIKESWLCSWKSALLVQFLRSQHLISSADKQTWHLPFQYNRAQMSRSESSGRRWRTSLVSVLCHYRPGLRLRFYNESALLAGTRGTDLTWEWAQLFTVWKIKWGLFDSPAWLKACRNIPNILNPALGVMRRKRIRSFRMQVRLGSDRLSRMCALSLASLLALNGRYCGDQGLWVTDGGWVTSAVVNATKCVNLSHKYKELKGCTQGQSRETWPTTC